MIFEKIDVTPDTPEWLKERDKSLGASDAPAILSLSPWSTPLECYQSKLGAGKAFDPVLGYIGHASEPTIAGWVEQFSDLRGIELESGFMARSVEYPWLHATFDRVSYDPSGALTIFQFKTGHQYTAEKWAHGTPLDVQAQVQQEILIAGTTGEWVVCWIGGREFIMRWVERDDTFISDILVPRTKEFWEDHVLAHVPPEPSTLGEQALVWPTAPDSAVELSETAYEAFQRRNVLLSDIRAQQAEADELQKVLGSYVQTAETLTYDGRPVATYKTQRGRLTLDHKALAAEHPDIAARYERRGQDYKVLRTVKEKTK